MSSEITPLATPQPRQQFIKNLYVVLGVLLILALTGLTIWGILYLARTFPAEIEALRDIFIILLALGSCLSGVVVVLMLIMVIRLVNMLEFEIKPILEKTNETLGTVRGTTRFVSDNVVQPTIRASSYVAGIRRGLKVLFGDPDRNLPR